MNRKLQIPAGNTRSLGDLTARLQALNGLLGVTDRELTVLGVLLMVSMVDPVYDRLDAATRLGMSVPVLNNIIKALVDKQCLMRDGKQYSYHPLLAQLDELDSITLTFADNEK